MEQALNKNTLNTINTPKKNIQVNNLVPLYFKTLLTLLVPSLNIVVAKKHPSSVSSLTFTS